MENELGKIKKNMINIIFIIARSWKSLSSQSVTNKFKK